jgi:hypothetical protein
MECVAAGIWDMIKPPDGATQAMTAAMNGTVGALTAAEIIANLVEDSFTHIKLPDATYTLTRNIMDGRLEQLAEFYQDRMDRLSLNEAALPPLELNKLLIGTRRDWENERFKIEQSETNILHSLVSAVTHYKKENAIALNEVSQGQGVLRTSAQGPDSRGATDWPISRGLPHPL